MAIYLGGNKTKASIGKTIYKVHNGIREIVIPDGTNVTFGYESGAPVERAEMYAISGEDLNAIAAITQAVSGKKGLMTTDDMIYWLNRAQFIPQGNAESEFSLSFNSNASGILPDVQKGSATSTFSLSFTSTAVGEL
jgi:hypothetical protein